MGEIPANPDDQNFVAPETGAKATTQPEAKAADQLENIPAHQEAIYELYGGVSEQYGPAGLAALDLIHEVDRPDSPEKTMRVMQAVDGVSYEEFQAIERMAFEAGANTDYLKWAIRYKNAENEGVFDLNRPEMPQQPTKA